MQPFFLADRRGSVSMMAAGCFTLLAAAAGLIVNASKFYVVKLREQRTADLASLAAANIPAPINNGSPTAAAIATAQNVAELNGFTASSVTVAADNQTQVRVSLAKSQSTAFGSLKTPTVIKSASAAKPGPGTIACAIASGGNLSVLSGAQLQASSCGAMAATYLEAKLGTVNVKGVAVGYAQQAEAPYIATANDLPPSASNFKYSYPSADPIAGSTAVALLNAQLAVMANGWPYVTSSPLTFPTPYVPGGGPNLSFVANVGWVLQSAAIGDLTVSGATVTFAGSGGPDPQCTRPTTIAGVTSVAKGSRLVLNSGCYVFQGDVTQADNAATDFVLNGNADVRLVFSNRIVNTGYGIVNFPRAAYSIAGGILNTNGGKINLGDGQKSLGGLIDNTHSNLSMANGPFYLKNLTMRQQIGTVTFGDGPFYIFGSSISNSIAGTMTFGQGAYYIGNTIIINSGGSGYPWMSFSGGPYYFRNSTLSLGATSDTSFGPGNFEFYNSYWYVNGQSLKIGSSQTAASGAATIALYNSTLMQTEGTVVATGVTIAAAASSVSLTGISGQWLAPIAAAPTYGYQNLAFYSIDAGVSYNYTQNSWISGVVYAPSAKSSFSHSYFTGGVNNGCLSVVSGLIQVDRNATLSLSPCNNFAWPSFTTLRAYLQY